MLFLRGGPDNNHSLGDSVLYSHLGFHPPPLPFSHSLRTDLTTATALVTQYCTITSVLYSHLRFHHRPPPPSSSLSPYGLLLQGRPANSQSLGNIPLYSHLRLLLSRRTYCFFFRVALATTTASMTQYCTVTSCFTFRLTQYCTVTSFFTSPLTQYCTVT